MGDEQNEMMRCKDNELLRKQDLWGGGVCRVQAPSPSVYFKVKCLALTIASHHNILKKPELAPKCNTIMSIRTILTGIHTGSGSLLSHLWILYFHIFIALLQGWTHNFGMVVVVVVRGGGSPCNC